MPGKYWHEFNTVKSGNGRMVSYVFMMCLLWYVIFLYLLYGEDMQNMTFNSFWLIGFIVPVVFGTYGLAIALQAVSNFTFSGEKQRLIWQNAFALMTFSFVPFFIAQLTNAIYPGVSFYSVWLVKIWIIIIIAKGIETTENVSLKVGAITAAAGILLIVAVSEIFLRYILTSILY